FPGCDPKGRRVNPGPGKASAVASSCWQWLAPPISASGNNRQTAQADAYPSDSQNSERFRCGPLETLMTQSSPHSSFHPVGKKQAGGVASTHLRTANLLASDACMARN